MIYSLLEAKKKTTVLVLSKDNKHVDRMADHVVIENQMKCLIQGAPLALKSKRSKSHPAEPTVALMQESNFAFILNHGGE